MTTIAGIEFEICGELAPVPLEELERCERLLSCTFPVCYREFVTTIGAGEFEDACLYVHWPSQIVRDTQCDRERLKEYWFWDESAAILPKERGITSIECFSSGDGHDLRFIPSDPSVFYFMSRYDESIVACTDLGDLLPLLEIEAVSHGKLLTFRPYRLAYMPSTNDHLENNGEQGAAPDRMG